MTSKALFTLLGSAQNFTVMYTSTAMCSFSLMCCSGNAVLCRAVFLWCSSVLVAMTWADTIYLHIHEAI